jgi:hypothetical protein
MLDRLLDESGRAVLDDYRAQAGRWTGQLTRLFGWLLVIEFGLAAVVYGLIVPVWPETPEFLASATGVWLLLLAGCRGFAVLAQRTGSTAFSRGIGGFQAAICAGTGFMLLHANWPSRPSAIATALTYSAAVLIVSAVLDAVVARVGNGVRVRSLLIRAGGWLVAGLVLMVFLNGGNAPSALAFSAVFVGVVEIVQGIWLLGPGADPARAARKRAELMAQLRALRARISVLAAAKRSA